MQYKGYKRGQRETLNQNSSPSQWARRDRLMSRDKNCRETSFVSHLSRNYPHRGVNFEREEKNTFLWGRDSLGGILGDNLGEGNCESKIVGRCPSTVQPVFPVLVFQLSKQPYSDNRLNRTPKPLRTVLGQRNSP